MMNAFKEVSETELEIIEVLWGEDSPRNFAWLLDHFNDQYGKQWKRQTLSTYLLRLSQKGLVCSENVGRTSEYRPALTRAEYEQAKAKNVLDSTYSGSVRTFMTALYDGKSISSDELSELKCWLAEQESVQR